MLERMLRKNGLCSVAATVLLAGGLTPLSTSAAAKDDGGEDEAMVETARDDTWVSVSGRVVTTTPESFKLDYGDGKITVEMDDFDFYGEANSLMSQDKVVVRGVVDDDMFERRTIEASSVYVEGLQTYFYANPADEEDFAAWSVVTPVEVGDIEFTGTVTSVTGREFTVDSGTSEVQVDTVALGYDPLDDDGYLQIETGDRVKVGGEFDAAVFDETELSADWIIELDD
jgi:uncharacterized protein YdeI (BOF family)